MSPEALNPAEMLEFTGNLGQLERDVSALAGDATSIWESGTQVDTAFRGLSAYYEAPEADRLFATTAPVAAGANEFCDELETVSQALGAYATEVRPLVDKLNRLRQEAAEFSTRIAGDDEWHYDDKLTGENNARRSEMLATWEAFQEAERACSNKIFALFSDFRFVQDDGKGDKPNANEYGYSADMLNNAQGLPWGDKVDESIHWYELHRQVKHFVWDGFIVDGVWGTVRGLATLVGYDGGAAAGQAWTNLAKVVTGLTIAIAPASALLPAAVGGDTTRRWLVESQNALKETGKAMISYDQWGKDNARAAGGATFNVLSTVLSGGVGAGLKGGAIARGVSAAAKVVNLVDPATYVAKGARFGALKIGDAMATLRNLSSGTYLELANGSYKIAEESVRSSELPPGSVLRPENSVRMIDPEGKVVYLNTETRLLHNADGTVIERPAGVKPEMSAEQRAAERQAAQPQRDQQLAGVGGRASEAGTRTGGGTTSGHDGSGGRGSGPGPRPGGAGGRGPDDLGPAVDDSLGNAGQSADDAARAGDEAANANQVDDATGSPDRSGDGPGGQHEGGQGANGPAQLGEGNAGSAPAIEPNFSRPALPPGQAELSLRELRALRGGRHRFTAAEVNVREMFGAGPERHYPVPKHDHPYYPVETPGGRKVDAPVDMPDGRTLALEVKHYLEFRSVKLKDGSSQVVKGEVPLSKGIVEQINKDLTLRRMDPTFDPRWVFMHAPPSQALRDYLVQARIIFVEYGPPPKK
ncbi:hypothetical protein BGM19_26925 [Streptomyces agglomeratus]|uniref:hypothetical protein n=1 Tax=Streptomyces agglomeratus TaxID=285458 RepID=UPI0008699A55|nr:hypothetical protein [Streptomyces agglomeratus]OEJ61108.1 hypothetical protein BGM19_26925 [Streptomyces agglomeratus]